MSASAENSISECPLADGQQTRNLLLFAACTALQYLAAPIGYVGVTQASLCRELGASDAVANLPATFYLGLTFSPAIIAWLVPYIAWLKRNLVTCYAITALSQAMVGLVLLTPTSDEFKIIIVIAQSAVFGITGPTAIAFLWEVIGRGTAEARRGLTLALAFGIGPLFAVLGSFGSQLILEGSSPPQSQGAESQRVYQFALLYAAAAPIMAMAAILSCLVIVPRPETDAVRQPFVPAVFGGLIDFLRNPVLRMATIVTILLYAGNTIVSNMNLYSEQVFGDAPMLHAGYQNATRFFFKMIAGLALGWLLNETNPRAGLLATGLIFLASVLLAMVATAETYLLVFGLYGAGELIGVYAPNYILSASNKQDMRRNLAFVTMMMAPAAPAGYLFGKISGAFGDWWGKTAGFKMSFAVCDVVMMTGIVLAALKLPARPCPEASGALSGEELR